MRRRLPRKYMPTIARIIIARRPTIRTWFERSSLVMLAFVVSVVGTVDATVKLIGTKIA